jgi:hypothetical protein
MFHIKYMLYLNEFDIFMIMYGAGHSNTKFHQNSSVVSEIKDVDGQI